MKPCSKTRSDKSTCANISLELPLFRHYLGMNAIIILCLLTLTILTQSPEQNSYTTPRCVLKNFTNFTGKHLYWSLFFYKVASLQACNVTKKRLLPTQVFSCEIWEILKNTYFEKHLNDCFCVLITSSYIDFYSTRFSFLQISSSLLRN